MQPGGAPVVPLQVAAVVSINRANQKCNGPDRLAQIRQRLPNTFLNNFDRDNGSADKSASIAQTDAFELPWRVAHAFLGRGRAIPLTVSRETVRSGLPNRFLLVTFSRDPNGLCGNLAPFDLG